MPKTKTKIKKMNKTLKRRKSNISSNKIKGGGNFVIPNYALNTHQVDPNYIQISTRNVVQQGSGYKKLKKYRKTQKLGGNAFHFASNQLSNPISNFPSYNSTQWLVGNYSPNSAAYVQPIGNYLYTGEKL